MHAGRWAQEAADRRWCELGTVAVEGAFKYLSAQGRAGDNTHGAALLRRRARVRMPSLAPAFPARTS
eukprot:5149846-Pyramimonas_sp.AAC.1